MEDSLAIPWAMLSAAALLQSWLIAVQTWEHRRFARGRLKWPAMISHYDRVAVIAPCRGLDPGLRENLRLLFRQSYANYELIFVVESFADPALDVINELRAEHPLVDSRVTVAGIADDSGQKVHNLSVALAGLDERIEILAFVDSDARPASDWLTQLVQRLDRPGVGATTGYRWFLPVRNTLPNLLAYGMNAGVAALLTKRGRQLIWGGSWAIRRDLFESLGILDAWRGTMGDDVVATAVVHRAGLRVLYEPGCMVASPVDYGWCGLAEFVRRQYGLARLYLPGWWALALAGVGLGAAAWWGGLLLVTIGYLRGSIKPAGAADFLGLLTAVHVLRGVLRYRLVAAYFPHKVSSLQLAALFDTLAGPLIGIAHLAGILSTVVVNRLHWRGICYRVDGRGCVVGREDLPQLMNHAESSLNSAARDEAKSRPEIVRRCSLFRA